MCSRCRGVEPSPEKVSGTAMRALHRLERSRRPPRTLSDAPFSLDERAEGELSRSVLRALIVHGEGRLRSLPSLQDARAAALLQTPDDAEGIPRKEAERTAQL